MQQIIFFIPFLFFLSCNSSDNKSVADSNSHLDTVPNIMDDSSIQKIDTTTLDGKRAFILNKFNSESPIRSADFDTLIDLTYDGALDYIIGYYGLTGSGIKNRIEVFLYDKKADNYFFDSLLTDIANPTFYIRQKKITGFYIGGGGGGGHQLEWLKNKWVVTKSFTVDNDNGKGKWVIKYPLKNKSETIYSDFQMIPPVSILETNVTE